MVNFDDAVLWEEYSWSEIENVIEETSMAIVPFGSTEQHGHHLALNVDTLHGYTIAKGVSEKTGVPVLPPLPYGAAQGHMDFTGTITLKSETLLKITKDICESLHESGVDRILLINSHMYNFAPVQSAVEDLKYTHPDLKLKTINWWEADPELSDFIAEDCPYVNGTPANVHANITETSNMLAMRPDLVDMEKAEDDPGYESHWDYPMRQVTETGAVGNQITESTEERGEELINKVVDSIAEYVEVQLNEEAKYPNEEIEK